MRAITMVFASGAGCWDRAHLGLHRRGRTLSARRPTGRRRSRCYYPCSPQRSEGPHADCRRRWRGHVSASRNGSQTHRSASLARAKTPAATERMRLLAFPAASVEGTHAPARLPACAGTTLRRPPSVGIPRRVRVACPVSSPLRTAIGRSATRGRRGHPHPAGPITDRDLGPRVPPPAFGDAHRDSKADRLGAPPRS